jgi:DNA-directed RNA polymerase specialized sigma subunit
MGYSKNAKAIRFVEKLLRQQKFFEVEIANQERALELNKLEQREAIEGQYLKADTYETKVQTSRVWSPELFVGQEHDYLLREYKTIEERIEYMKIMLQALEDSLAGLNKRELEILTLYYKEGQRVVDVADKVYLSPQHLKVVKRKTLNKLVIALRPFIQDAIM